VSETRPMRRSSAIIANLPVLKVLRFYRFTLRTRSTFEHLVELQSSVINAL